MPGWWLRIAFLALAAAGIVVLLQNSSPASAHQPFWRLTDPWEMRNHLEAARAILFGPSLHQWYASGNTTGYSSAIRELKQLISLPDAEQTPVQGM